MVERPPYTYSDVWLAARTQQDFDYVFWIDVSECPHSVF